MSLVHLFLSQLNLKIQKTNEKFFFFPYQNSKYIIYVSRLLVDLGIIFDFKIISQKKLLILLPSNKSYQLFDKLVYIKKSEGYITKKTLLYYKKKYPQIFILITKYGLKTDVEALKLGVGGYPLFKLSGWS